MTSPDKLADRPAWPPPAYRPRWGDLPALAWRMAREGRQPVGWPDRMMAVFAWPIALTVMAMLHSCGHLAHLDREATLAGRGSAVRPSRRARMVCAAAVALPAMVVTFGLGSPQAGAVVIAVCFGPVIVVSSVRFRAIAVTWRAVRRPHITLDAETPTLELANLYGSGTPMTARLCHGILDDAIARGWQITLAARNPRLERTYRRWGFVPAGDGWMTNQPQPHDQIS